jgi:hypothetical protein
MQLRYLKKCTCYPTRIWKVLIYKSCN